MELKDSVIWITGASSGIGSALARVLITKGCKLVLSSRNEEILKQVEKSLGASPDFTLVLPLDLTKPETFKDAVEEVKEKFGTVDFLINNGGISQRSEALETNLETDRKIFEVNYFGAVALTKAVLPIMTSNKKGHITVISSVVGKFGFPLRTSYSASKHALQGFFESLRFELMKYNIGVLLVCPGRIQTNISLHAVKGNGEEHGQMDEGQMKGMDVMKCADKIVKAMQSGRKNLLVGNKELAMVYLRKFVPGLFYKIAANVKST